MITWAHLKHKISSELMHYCISVLHDAVLSDTNATKFSWIVSLWTNPWQQGLLHTVRWKLFIVLTIFLTRFILLSHKYAYNTKQLARCGFGGEIQNLKNRPDQNLCAICKMTCSIMVLHLLRSCTMRVLFAIKFSKILSWNMCRRLHEGGHHLFLCKHVQCKAAQFLM